MFKLNDVIRPNIKRLKPYTSARDEYPGEAGIFLDANENPFGDLNRYPDPYQREVKEKLALLKGVEADRIFIGNGSDEVIDLVFRCFCEPGTDKALIFNPTYGMYAVSAAINNVELVEVPLNENFQPDPEKFGQVIADATIKIVFLCTPNNPTANTFEESRVRQMLEDFKGIIIIDEAYIDFSETGSWLEELNNYPNLIVMQTFSKAWGLAAARLGVAYANTELIGLFNKVKPPYNISKLNQQAALRVLENEEIVKNNIKEILRQRQELADELGQLRYVQKIYPSEANFLLVQVLNATKIYEYLVNRRIIVRNRHSLVRNCLRITVGTKSENKALIEALKELEL